jgi:hypothetical protein
VLNFLNRDRGFEISKINIQAMKRIIILISVALFTTSILSAQNEEDALRYSRQFITGTARSVGMGGAMGAIGGDFTSLSINPAGIGVYRSNEFTFSPSLNWNSTQSDFLRNKIDQTRYGMKLGNVGYVISNTTDKEKGLVSTSFGFGYNQLNNFNSQILMSGTNNSSSLLDNFTRVYNDLSLDISDFYEGLAYDVDLIVRDSITLPYYNDFQRGGYGQHQQRRVSTSGSIGEYVFSMGSNISNKLYFGATFGVQRVRYEKSSEHTETDQNNNIDYTQKFVFNEDLLTRGYGFNLKLGVIARPLNFLRLGAAYHIPTYYFLHYRFASDIQAWYDPSLNIASKTSESPILNFDYQLKTPSKFVGSAAITIGKLGLVSIDYERVNYSNANLQAPDFGFVLENTAIKDIYKSTNNLRMGAELRLGTGYLRGGYAMYGSPYKIVDPSGDIKYSVISGGVGIRNSDFFMDLSYASGVSSEAYYMYIPEMTTGSINKSKLNNVILTVGFRF